MTEKQLIAKLQTLKNIKPRENWVVFAKANILGGVATAFQPAKKPGIKELFSRMFNLTLQRKLAYSFATIALMFAGVFGFAQYTLPGDMLFEVKKITEQSQSALTGETSAKSNVETFKKRSHDLAEAVRNKKENNISSAIQEVKNATKTLNLAIENDANLAKEIALEIKNNDTLLAVLSEEGLEENSDILRTILIQLVKDLKSATLTESEASILSIVEKNLENNEISQAWENIWLIGVDSSINADDNADIKE